MTDREIILRHLTFYEKTDSLIKKSAHMAALRDARLATKRDQNTGKKEPGADHSSWLGAVGYLILLDQIGKCFSRKGFSFSKDDDKLIAKALRHFAPSIPELERLAIHALRCALAHDYTLSNPKVSDSRLQHHFIVHVLPRPLVVLPQEQWDGVLTKQPDRKAETLVNLEKLGDLVEEVHQELLKLANTDELEISLPGRASELLNRYSMMSPFVI